jgi:hypothetical protein
MWEGMSLFDPSWDDFIKAANGSDASLNLGEGEELLWLGKASGKYASIYYYPRQMWSVFGMLTISLLFVAYIASTAPNIGDRIIYIYLILLLFFAILSISVYVYAYRYWLYTGKWLLAKMSG